MLRAAIAAVEPSQLIANTLRASATDVVRTRSVNVIAAGKAAWPMAEAFARHAGAAVRNAVVSGPRARGEAVAARFESCESFDGGHPEPDDASERAGRRALALARGGGSDTLIVLLSGGASAMLAVPADGITLDDKVRATRSLLRAGIPIDALNCVRKHLSEIKGGQLAAAAPESVTLALSDVHGPVPDDPSVIGSGLTVADPTTFAQALAIAERASTGDGSDVPDAVLQRLRRGARGDLAETPKPGDPRLRRARYHVIGNRLTAMAGAAAAARELGYDVHLVTEATAGEARIAGERFTDRALGLIRQASGRRMCVIASGETTVRVRGEGRGGRNQEFALGIARALAGQRHAQTAAIVAASAGTDGVDGPTDAAGARVDASTLRRAARAGLDADDALARNDSYTFFRQLGDLLVWGPTGTNVGDVHVLLHA